MKGNEEIVELLNQLLTNELTAINQYFIHAKMCENWGYERLAHKLRDESIDEMKHADRLVERILLLDGLPNLQDIGKLQIGQNVPELLQADLALERTSQGALKNGVAICEQAQDYVSRKILVDILDDTEEHIDHLEAQLALLAEIGIANYLQSQMDTGS